MAGNFRIYAGEFPYMQKYFSAYAKKYFCIYGNLSLCAQRFFALSSEEKGGGLGALARGEE